MLSYSKQEPSARASCCHEITIPLGHAWFVFLLFFVPLALGIALHHSNGHCDPDGRGAHKHMDECGADRDHAMCSIQNRTIPVVQLMHFQKLPDISFKALAFSIAYSNAKCFSAT
jgi:hypothetical protein